MPSATLADLCSFNQEAALSADATTLMRQTVDQMARYLVGAVVALVIDMALVTVGVKVGVPVLLARLGGLLVGITTTYFFNRRFTFKSTHSASFRDWGEYLLRQSVGSLLNFVASTGLIYLSDRSIWQIWGAVLVGAAIGFCVNFFAARRQLHG